MNKSRLRANPCLRFLVAWAFPGCSQVGASHVFLTDGADEQFAPVLENCRESCVLNQLSPTQYTVSGLSWGEIPPPNDAVPPMQDLDWIIAADILYEPSQFENIAATLFWLLSNAKDSTRCVLVYHQRSALRVLVFWLRPLGIGAST
eukprot:GABV01002268.1.p1 GENE.GABV01002268.1~~GABV01002268.1.p1  ORF type:complete len:147 (+),score=23.83 GABV01002268.1:162-602(+)